MIVPLVRRTVLVSSCAVSSETRSRILLSALVLLVVGGFAASVLAPILFSAAFQGVQISPSDLTPFMNGW